MTDEKTKLYILDVFTKSIFSGNPLAVVVSKHRLAQDFMLNFAKEMNFSETTFILDDPNQGGVYAVKIFTPAKEIAFAGHPIIGTAWVIQSALSKNTRNIKIEIGIGLVEVEVRELICSEQTFWFKAPPITFGRIYTSDLVTGLIGVPESEICSDIPVQVLSSGVSAVLVPLKHHTSLHRAKIDILAYHRLIAGGFPSLIYLFTRESSSTAHDIESRFFFEANGVREDPATGNGAAFLGAYLLNNKIYEGAGIDIKIFQGAGLKRPSTIMVSANVVSERYDIRVGGSVVKVMEGDIESDCSGN